MGITRAIPMVAVRPGRAPRIMPSTEPKAHQRTVYRLETMDNPRRKSLIKTS